MFVMCPGEWICVCTGGGVCGCVSECPPSNEVRLIISRNPIYSRFCDISSIDLERAYLFLAVNSITAMNGFD